MTHQLWEEHNRAGRAAATTTTAALEHAQRLSEEIRERHSAIDRSTSIAVAMYGATGVALAVAIWARAIPTPLVGAVFVGFLSLLVILLLARAVVLWKFATRADAAADRIDAGMGLSQESDDLTDPAADFHGVMVDLLERADSDARILLEESLGSEQQLLTDVRERVERVGQGHETLASLMADARADIETRLTFARDEASQRMRRARDAAAHQMDRTQEDIALALVRLRDEDPSGAVGGEALAEMLLQQSWREAREHVAAAQDDAAALLWREQAASREIFARALRLASEGATKGDDERG